jgi:hypothetical protein
MRLVEQERSPEVFEVAFRLARENRIFVLLPEFLRGTQKAGLQ